MDGPAESLSGEKRLLIVVFSDLVGSTELSLSLDPEDYAEVVLGYHERGRQIVVEHGGSIANYLGDGLLAQFGYPAAHEDDADRALRAGMAIRQAVGEMTGRSLAAGLRVRVGIHAGPTVVGRTRANERGDLALFGETANIAARVQAAGGPNEILVTEDVATRLREEYVLADLGAPALKGVHRPIRVFEVMGEARGRTRRASTAMIGRDDELGVLERGLEASRGGAGGAIGICGPAGVGKTRLVTALADDVAPRHWLEVRGSELGSDSAFGVMAQLVARALGLAPSASERDRAARLDEFLAANPPPDVPSAPLKAVLTGDSMTAPQSSESAFRSIVELGLHVLLAATEDLGHAVVVVEDLHWVDPSSRAFIARVVEVAPTRRLLVVLTERPDAASGRTVVEGLTEVLRIEPLADEDVRHIVDGVATAGIDEDLVETIVRRAEGIPLYAEELARPAGQRSPGELPYTLQASLLARLDRTPDLREVARLASAVGTYVRWDVMGAACGLDVDATRRALDRLVGAGVLVPDADPGAHFFRHSLLRDAIYASLLRSDRRRAHRAVAAGLEQLGTSVDRPAEVLAYHLAEGGDPVRAAERFASAALTAARSGSCEECRVLCRRGLDLVSAWPDAAVAKPIELALTMTLGNATNAVEGYGAPGQLELWRHAEELCVATGDQLERSSAMNGQAVALMLTGDAHGAMRESRRIIRLGEDHQDRVALLRGHSTLAMQALFLGEVTTALTSADTGIALYRDGDYFGVTYGFGTDHGVILHATATMAHTLCGHGRASVAAADAAIALAEELDSPISLCLALVMCGMSTLLWEESGPARSLLERAQAHAATYGLPFYERTAELLGAGAAAVEGDPEALERAVAAAGALIEGGAGIGTSAGWWALALAQEAAGHHDIAHATAVAAIEATSASAERVLDVELHRLAARTGRAGAQITPAEARSRLSSIGSWAAERGMFLEALRAQRDLVALGETAPAANDRLLELGSLVESVPATPSTR